MRRILTLGLVALAFGCAPSHPPEQSGESARAAPPGPPASTPATLHGRPLDLAPLDAGSGSDGGARATRLDADIVRDIERTIHQNSVLMAQGATVRVTCERGEVTLRGTVKDEAARASVTSMVRQTPGVLRINDLMKAIDPHPTDWNPDDPHY